MRMKIYYDWDDGCYEKITHSNELAEEIQDELVNLMIKYLENHEIFRLLELVVSAVATKEQEGQ